MLLPALHRLRSWRTHHERMRTRARQHPHKLASIPCSQEPFWPTFRRICRQACLANSGPVFACWCVLASMLVETCVRAAPCAILARVRLIQGCRAFPPGSLSRVLCCGFSGEWGHAGGARVCARGAFSTDLCEMRSIPAQCRVPGTEGRTSPPGTYFTAGRVACPSPHPLLPLLRGSRGKADGCLLTRARAHIGRREPVIQIGGAAVKEQTAEPRFSVRPQYVHAVDCALAVCCYRRANTGSRK